MAFIDNDKPPTQAAVDQFKATGGKLVTWRQGYALKDELFRSLPEATVQMLIDRAKELTEDAGYAAHAAA